VGNAIEMLNKAVADANEDEFLFGLVMVRKDNGVEKKGDFIATYNLRANQAMIDERNKIKRGVKVAVWAKKAQAIGFRSPLADENLFEYSIKLSAHKKEFLVLEKAQSAGFRLKAEGETLSDYAAGLKKHVSAQRDASRKVKDEEKRLAKEKRKAEREVEKKQKLAKKIEEYQQKLNEMNGQVA